MGGKKLFLFRTASGYHYGMGHLIRMVSLALHVKKRMPDATFLFLINEGRSSQRILRDRGFSYIVVSRLNDFKDKMKVLMETHRDRTVFVDLYERRLSEEKWFNRQLAKVVVFDEFSRTHPDAHFVVSAHQLGKSVNREGKARTVRLSGMRFWVMHPDFCLYARQPKPVPTIPKSILVSIGGSDLKHLTPRVLRAIKPLVRRMGIKVSVVLGNESRLKRDVLKKILPNVRVLQSVRRMAPLISSSDLGITSAGFGKWEFLCLGVPVCTLTVVKHQEYYMKCSNGYGLITSLGRAQDLNESLIQKKLEDLIRDRQRREMISKEGPKLVDGSGAMRILREVLKNGRN